MKSLYFNYDQKKKDLVLWKGVSMLFEKKLGSFLWVKKLDKTVISIFDIWN